MESKHCFKIPPKGMIAPRVMFLSKNIRKSFNQSLSEQGLFSGQEDVLFRVIDNEGITLSELAAELKISNASACVSVKRMEKAGFIIKKADEKNARIIRLYPTEKAKNASANTRAEMDKTEDLIKQGMTEEEQMLLSDLLEKSISNILKQEGK